MDQDVVLLKWPTAATCPATAAQISRCAGLRRLSSTEWTGAISADLVLDLRGLVAGHPGEIGQDLADRLRHAAQQDTRPVTETQEVAGTPPPPDVPDPKLPQGPKFIFDRSLLGLQGIPITELDCLSPAKKKAFNDAGIASIYDLLMVKPRRYLDRSRPVGLDEAPRGVDTTLLVTVVSVSGYDRHRKFVKAKFRDDGGREIAVIWFRTPWVAKNLTPGDRTLLFGKIENYVANTGRRIPQMTNPMMEVNEESPLPIIPIYSQIGVSGKGKPTLSTWDFHRAALESVGRLNALDDPIDQGFLQDLKLISRRAAFSRLHAPRHMGDVEMARRRLAYDELFRIQLTLGVTSRRNESSPKQITNSVADLPAQHIDALPFQLTKGQQSAWETIRVEMRSTTPMYRLLHGEVGAGKTLVAVLALLETVGRGQQVAVMAPTDILAGQLLNEINAATQPFLHGDWPIIVEALASRTTAASRRRVLAGLTDGTINVVVGTHSVLSNDVQFKNLGLIVIDEQHRFGVEQRGALKKKQPAADCLIMTATPIPRTLALTAFGDLDVSTIPDIPPGRSPINTHWIAQDVSTGDPTATPWKQIREAATKGRPSFVICPLVGETEKLQAAAAETTLNELTHGALRGLRLGLVHGQQKAAERDAVLHDLKQGTLDAVIGTTVLEVGVNVPKATQIVILNAARFGIAQLHQLRGRIGRGPAETGISNDCWLIGEATNPIAEERLAAMTQTSSGLELAETDLKNRGIGDLVGVTQSGHSGGLIRFVDIKKDLALVEHANNASRTLLATDPTLAKHPMWLAEVAATIGNSNEAGNTLRS